MKVQAVDYKSKNAAQTFAQSLRDTGFAVLNNHPIDPKLIEAVFKEWEDFFKSSTKNEYLFDPQVQAGYFPFKTENAKDYKVKDLKEFFHLYHWNKLPKTMSDKTLEYFAATEKLGVEMLGWLQELTPNEIKKNFSMPLTQMSEGSRETLLRTIHYPPLAGNEEEGAIRAAAHEDINLITLLPAATEPGLQVQDLNGKWHDVSCDRGSYAINAGDMLQMATQGYYKSTTHRVINPVGEASKKSRLSMPLFIHPRRDGRLSQEHTAGSYLDQRLQEIGLLLKPRN